MVPARDGSRRSPIAGLGATRAILSRVYGT